MLVCKECGHQNANGESWCRNPGCGAYLGFFGQAAQTGRIPPMTSPATPTTEPAPAPPRGGPPTRELPVPQGAPGPSLPAPAQRPTAAPEAPAAVAQGRAGDVPCGSCGWPNSPSRQFCQHCATPLHALPVYDQPEVAPVGRQPRASWVAPAAVAGAVVLFAGAAGATYALTRDSNGGGGSGSTGGSAPQGSSAVPRGDIQSVQSPSQSRDSDPAFDRKVDNIDDGDPTTFWSSLAGTVATTQNTGLSQLPCEGDGQRTPQVVGFGFSKDEALTSVQVVSGASGNAGFDERPRPKEIELFWGDWHETHTLADTKDPQTVVFDHPSASYNGMNLWVCSVYDATSPPAGDPGAAQRVSISEVTFFARS